ncbi:cell surface glycoprotein 1-like [Vitis riparia]|uniref:cell surface glycoprotein 1-like n=1 Tax=Vitis riparia TaxID=96939 RepID=UPI00155B0508|nr:cell surface glycoprotein 1-like [Vitis riparia]
MAYDAQLGAPTGLEHPEIPQSEHPEEPQQVEIPTDIKAPASTMPSTGSMPESFELQIGTKEEPNQSNSPATFSETAMAKTQGAKSSSPSTCLRIPRESPIQAAIPEPPRPPVVPPPVEDAPMSPPSRRYQTRRSLTMAGTSSSQAQKSSSGPPKKKSKILEHLGCPTKPQLERRCICQEIFTLDKWTSMTAYGANQGAPTGPEHPEQPEEPQPVEIPADITPPTPTVASIEPLPEVTPSAPQTTSQTPPVIPPISEPSPSSEPRIAISIIEYRGLCHTFQALATSQSILTQ